MRLRADDLPLAGARVALAAERAQHVHHVVPLDGQADLGVPDARLGVHQALLLARVHDLVVADEVGLQGVRHLATELGRLGPGGVVEALGFGHEDGEGVAAGVALWEGGGEQVAAEVQLFGGWKCENNEILINCTELAYYMIMWAGWK